MTAKLQKICHLCNLFVRNNMTKSHLQRATVNGIKISRLIYELLSPPKEIRIARSFAVPVEIFTPSISFNVRGDLTPIA